MSEAPSESSVRIVDVDDAPQPDTVPQDHPDESDGSESSSDGEPDDNHQDDASDAADDLSENDQQVNGDGTRVVTPPSSPLASQS